jgi:ABC-type multidrug transport system ATPase subunit
MYITKVKIRGYRALTSCDIEFNEGLNIIVGDNEAGKSTVIECLSLALTGQLNGRPIQTEIHPYLFSLSLIEKYVADLKACTPSAPPSISIEVFFANVPELAEWRGDDNSEKAEVPGIKWSIEFDEAYRAEYADYTLNPDDVRTIPTEYYKAICHSFARKQLTPKKIPLSPVTIDASRVTGFAGANRYVAALVKEALPVAEQVQLSLSYRKLQDVFLQDPTVKKINDELATRTGKISEKTMSMALDATSRGGWESGLMPNLNDIPISMVGKGEQNSVKIKLALEKNSKAHIFLVEEPENHLSHSRLHQLIESIVSKAGDRQVLITTHSSFVLNKLGINNVILFKDAKPLRLNALSKGTYEYFRKLPGHDTLRLILSSRSILVEGPSDELIVQRAFSEKHKVSPLERSVDVISVKSLAFKRFLEIAKALNIRADVVTDNDGDVAALEQKYSDYKGDANIFIRYDADEAYPTLEPQMLKANSLSVINEILGTAYGTDAELIAFMTKSGNKTDVALALFDTTESIAFPSYINDAVE